MFYEESDISELLKCAHCATRFDSSIRLLPCGNSICDECSRKIHFRSGDPNSSDVLEFDCKLCKISHKIYATSGGRRDDCLPQNLKLLKLLNEIRPKEIYRGEIMRNFKLMASDIKSSHSTLDKLISNADMEIKNYCDKIRKEIKSNLDDSIDKINKNYSNLIREIDEYESTLLNSLKQLDENKNDESDSHIAKDIANLISDSTRFYNDCELKLKKAFIDERDILKATKNAQELKQKQETLKNSFMNKLFNNKFLRFESTSEKCQQLGKLIYVDSLAKKDPESSASKFLTFPSF